jgi:hypothetical protein
MNSRDYNFLDVLQGRIQWASMNVKSVHYHNQRNHPEPGLAWYRFNGVGLAIINKLVEPSEIQPYVALPRSPPRIRIAT